MRGLEPDTFDAVINVASSHAHGGYPAALLALRAGATGGVVLLGEGYWARTPSPSSWTRSAARRRTSSARSTELLAQARAAGLEPALQALASVADWARYEETLAANAERGGAGRVRAADPRPSRAARRRRHARVRAAGARRR